MSDNNKYKEILIKYILDNIIFSDYDLPNYISNDDNIMKELIKHDGLYLQLASPRLKGNKEIVLAAVQQNGSLLIEYASDALKNDKEVVLAAVQQDSDAIEYASDALKNDKVVLAAVQQNGSLLKFASDALKNDEEVVLAAVQQNGLVYAIIPNQLKNNKKVIFACVQQNGLALSYIIDYYLSLNLYLHNKELVSIAVQQNIQVLIFLPFLSPKIKNDKKFLIECYRNNKNSIQYNEFIKEFDNLENEIYNNNIFMKENAEILDLVNNNREQLCDYLWKNNKHDIIYQNDKIAEYIRDNHKIVIYSLNDIKLISNHDIEEEIEVVTEVKTEEEIKQEYSNSLFKIFPKLTPIFID